jgi:hypothetical protein
LPLDLSSYLRQLLLQHLFRLLDYCTVIVVLTGGDNAVGLSTDSHTNAVAVSRKIRGDFLFVFFALLILRQTLST